ncbi:hypothetical protein [Flavobacterium longum]|uniref:hypothetical protein n=1 Tax=Flavobacterium longum TaxID=1299340 RepID=UPI0039E7C310
MAEVIFANDGATGLTHEEFPHLPLQPLWSRFEWSPEPQQLFSFLGADVSFLHDLPHANASLGANAKTATKSNMKCHFFIGISKLVKIPV